MAILRKEKRSNYTAIDNAIFRNYDLSLKAKGLLCQMLSLPDGWQFSVEGLTRLSTDGKSAVTSALNELQEAGYFYREQSRNNGKMSSAVYVISEVPFAEKPSAENPSTEKPMTENPPQLNTKELNTYESNTNRYSYSDGQRKSRFVPPTVGEVAAYISEKGYHIDPEIFIDFYQSKGWKVGKDKMTDWKAAVRNWERRHKEDRGMGSKSLNPFTEMLKNGDY